MFGTSWLPVSVFGDESICEDDELSGNGDQGDLWRFSMLSQALVEGLHVGIKARGAERGEIEDAAHDGASAPDDAEPITLAGLIRDWGEAGEHGDLLGGRAADLGEASKESCRDRKAEAWDRSEDSVTLG